MLQILALAALLVIAGSVPAHAEPITIALFGSVFASSFLGGVVTFAITSVFSMGVSLLASAILGDQQQQQQRATPGIQLDVQMGDANPVAFPVGYTATGGTRRYIGTWGQSGETPNAYLTDVIQISDLPLPGQPGIIINGQKCTIDWNAAPTEQGYPVADFRVEGVDYLWVQYVDGTQSTANAFLAEKFAAHPERPWTYGMIGLGCPYVIVTTLFNRDLFSSNPTCVIEPPIAPMYDVRKDSTEGGFGPHRWDDPSTWEPSKNNVVIAYNVIRGIRYINPITAEVEWIYGGQNLPAFQLPAASVMAAANECDALRENADGTFEPQFQCGTEIRGDIEPLSVVQELMKGCAGRIAEVGGIFKFLVGAPGSAVYSFTDDDILVTRSQSYAPFPQLDSTHNGIEATYPEPAEGWKQKDAPARYSSALELEDGERRLATGVNFTVVPYAVQVQHLMRLMIEEERRFRQHSFFLPPEAWVLEPGVDVVSWTSARNGYVNKKFLVVHARGSRSANQLVQLKEIEPGDYGWSSAYEMPTAVGSTLIVRAPVQPMVGWQAFPATFFDDLAAGRWPTIEVRCDGNQVDVRAIRVTVRLLSSGAVVFDGELPYGTPAPGPKSYVLNAVFLPNTTYEVAGIFVPFSSRRTEQSSWITVTTPDVSLAQYQLEAWIKERVTDVVDVNEDRFSQLEAGMARMAAIAAQRLLTDNVLKGEVAKQVERMELRVGKSNAFIEEVRLLVVSADESFAQYKLDIGSILDGPTGLKARVTQQGTTLTTLDSAFGTFKDTTEVELYGPSGTTGLKASVTQHGSAIATLEGQVAGSWGVDIDVNGYVTGIKLINAGSAISAFYVVADKFIVAQPGVGGAIPFVVGTIGGVTRVGITGDLILDGTFYGSRIIAGTVDALQLAQNGVTVDKIAYNAATKIRTFAAGAITLPTRDGVFGGAPYAFGVWSESQWGRTLLASSGYFNLPVGATVTIVASFAAHSNPSGAGPVYVGTSPSAGNVTKASENRIEFSVYVDGVFAGAADDDPVITSGFLNVNPFTPYPQQSKYSRDLFIPVELAAGAHIVELRARWRSNGEINYGPIVDFAGAVLLINHKTTVN